MEFLYPNVLYFMLPPLFVLFGLWLTQEAREAKLFEYEMLERLRVYPDALSLKVRNILFFLSAVFMIVALSGPMVLKQKVIFNHTTADIVFALDISSDMADDFYKAKKIISQIIQTSDKNTRVGIIAFDDDVYLLSPLSFDHQGVLYLLQHLKSDVIFRAKKNFMKLIDSVTYNAKSKYLFVITNTQEDFSKEIALAKKKNIHLFFITPQTNIKEIQKIASSFDTSKIQQLQKYTPLFYYPLGLALLLFLIATSSLSSRWQKTFLILFLFSFPLSNAKAGIFDFIQYHKAKQAYENGQYKIAEQIYLQYAKQKDEPTLYYDLANTFYKEKKYKKAIFFYKKAYFTKEKYNAMKYANLAKSYVKLGGVENLYEAKKAYEKSLSFVKDREVKEDLEVVKRLLFQYNTKRGKKLQMIQSSSQNNQVKKEKKKDEVLQKKTAKELLQMIRNNSASHLYKIN